MPGASVNVVYPQPLPAAPPRRPGHPPWKSTVIGAWRPWCPQSPASRVRSASTAASGQSADRCAPPCFAAIGVAPQAYSVSQAAPAPAASRRSGHRSGPPRAGWDRGGYTRSQVVAAIVKGDVHYASSGAGASASSPFPPPPRSPLPARRRAPSRCPHQRRRAAMSRCTGAGSAVARACAWVNFQFSSRLRRRGSCGVLRVGVGRGWRVPSSGIVGCPRGPSCTPAGSSSTITWSARCIARQATPHPRRHSNHSPRCRSA